MIYLFAGDDTKNKISIFENIFEREETRDFVLKKLNLMGESPNSFIFLEGKLNKGILDAFKKVGPKRPQINIFILPKAKKEKFDNFLVANAFVATHNSSPIQLALCGQE